MLFTDYTTTVMYDSIEDPVVKPCLVTGSGSGTSAGQGRAAAEGMGCHTLDLTTKPSAST